VAIFAHRVPGARRWWPCIGPCPLVHELVQASLPVLRVTSLVPAWFVQMYFPRRLGPGPPRSRTTGFPALSRRGTLGLWCPCGVCIAARSDCGRGGQRGGECLRFWAYRHTNVLEGSRKAFSPWTGLLGLGTHAGYHQASALFAPRMEQAVVRGLRVKCCILHINRGGSQILAMLPQIVDFCLRVQHDPIQCWYFDRGSTPQAIVCRSNLRCL